MYEPTLPLPDRFWAKAVEDANGCMIWKASVANNGYGQFWWDGGVRSAHRLAYIGTRGPVPEGLQIDHLCRVRACINPEHLEAVTASVNMLRKPPVPWVSHVVGQETIFHALGTRLAAECRHCRKGQRRAA